MLNFNEVRKMPIGDLLRNAEFREHYILLYNTCHKSNDGAVHFDRETQFLKKMMMDNQKIGQANSLSVMTCLLDLAYHGLSIEPISKPLAYITPRGHNLGTKENPQWEQRVLLTISPYGELSLRIRSGIIKYADNPQIVYRGDIFEKENGKIHHIARYESEEMTHSYIKITRYDGSVEYKDFSMSDFQAMRKKSDSQNGSAWTGGTNGQPMRGMIEAKTIKHTFNNYPRLKLGASTVLVTDELDQLDNEAAYASLMGRMASGEPPKAQQQQPQPVAQRSENNPSNEDNPLGDTPAPVQQQPPAPQQQQENSGNGQNTTQQVLPNPDEIPTYDF